VSSYYVVATIFFCACATLQGIGAYLLFRWRREKRRLMERQAADAALQPAAPDEQVDEQNGSALRDAVTAESA
jgi:hypothetical protein